MHECAGVFADAMCTESNADDKTATNGGCQRRADLNNNTCMCVCVSMLNAPLWPLHFDTTVPCTGDGGTIESDGRGSVGGWVGVVSSDLKLNGMQCGAVDVAAH